MISHIFPLTYPDVYLFISYHIPSYSYPRISCDIHNDLKILILPLTYPFISFCFSIVDILLFPHLPPFPYAIFISLHPLRSPPTYPLPRTSPLISQDLQILIPRAPAIYPAGFCIRFRLVLLAAACCIAFTQAYISPPGAGLSGPGDPAAGPTGAWRWGHLAGRGLAAGQVEP